ncbi:MAG: C4-type zinc ribbon domain-containing protein [candidate division KSB1 bacterium]
MFENIQILLELQEVDRQLYASEKAKGDLPKSLEELKRKVAELTGVYDQKTAHASNAERQRRAVESALALARERKKKYETQLYAVKTNKEYDAITLELEHTEKEIDQSETKILETLEAEANLKKEIALYAEQLQAATQERDKQEELLNQMMEQNRHQVEQLQNARQNLIVGVKPGLLRSYERILRGKDGLAVVKIVRGSCGGCSTRITSQRVMEIREMREIYYCESCGRILLSQEEEPVAA